MWYKFDTSFKSLMHLSLEYFLRIVEIAQTNLNCLRNTLAFSGYLVVDGVLEWLVGREMWRVADEGGANDLEQNFNILYFCD